MERLKGLLKGLLRGYCVFAVFHVLYKIRSVILRFRRANKLLKKVPGGHYDDYFAVELGKNVSRYHDYWLDHVVKHGPKADILKGPGPEIEVIFNSPRAVEWMLKNEFKHCTKPSGDQDYLFYMLRRFIGDEGIFTLRHGTKAIASEDVVLAEEHKTWNAQRKTSSKIFTKNNFITMMGGTFYENANKMIDVLRVSATDKKIVDMQEKFFAFTMDSIQKIFFDVDMNTLDGKSSDDFGNAFDGAHGNMMTHLLGSIPQQVLATFVLPYPFGSSTIESGVGDSLTMKASRLMGKNYAEFERNIKILDKICGEVIDKTKTDPDLKNRVDMVANFLNAKGGENLTNKQLRDIILNLTIAGRDTTACALTWMMFLLTQNPDVQQKLQAEIDEKLGDKEPSLEDLSPENMPYLNGVFYEALRLHPPVPLDMKRATDDLVFLDGKTVIPKDCHLIFSPYVMGRNPEVYDDPLKVDPNRWIPFKQPSLYEFPVFQAGPRFCLGKDMAQFEAKLLISRLLRNFTFELKKGEAEKITYSFNITMSLCNSPQKDSHNLWIQPKLR